MVTREAAEELIRTLTGGDLPDDEDTLFFDGTLGAWTFRQISELTGIETWLEGKTTDDLAEGVSNLYHTSERVDDRVHSLLQDVAGKLTWTYDDEAGTLTPVVTYDSQYFSGTNWLDLTDAGATTLHKHDHGGLDGLGDDDHTQYLLANATRGVSANWDLGDYQVRAKQFYSDTDGATGGLLFGAAGTVNLYESLGRLKSDSGLWVPSILRSIDNSLLQLLGASASTAGAEVLLFGRDHNTDPGNLITTFGGYDATGEFRVRHINTAGTLATILTVASTGQTKLRYNAESLLRLYRPSIAGVGVGIEFAQNNATPVEKVNSKIISQQMSAGVGVEKADLRFSTMVSGTLTETLRLHWTGNTSLGTNSLLFGTFGSEDVELKRNAANVLETPDSFLIGGTLGSAAAPVSTAYITTIDLGTNTITDGNLTGTWTGIVNLTASGTVQAEHLYSTDDAVVTDQLTVGNIIFTEASVQIGQSGTPAQLDVNPYQNFRLFRATSGASEFQVFKADASADITARIVASTGNFTSIGTVQAEHLYSTDDAVIDGWLDFGGNSQASPAPKINLRGNTTAIEFGHNNPAGYGSSIGHTEPTGYPFVAFCTEHTGATNFWTTRGIKGSVIRSDLGGGFVFATVPLVSTAGQSLVNTMTLNTSGNLVTVGDVTVGDDLFIADNGIINVGTGNDLSLSHDGSNSYIANITGTLYILAKAAENAIVIVPDGAVTLYYDNVAKLATTTGGISITGTLTLSSTLLMGGQNIGSTTSEIGNVYLGDAKQLYFGADQDARMYFNGTNQVLDVNSGDFYLRVNASENALVAVANGAVTLYHDNAARFATSAAGGTLTGLLNATGGFSDNGTDGIDTTFLDNDGNTITVSGGIVTAKTAP